MPNETNVNTGNSGEYFVAGELERRGFTVAVPMSNVKDFDILAVNRETHEQFAIQVKTTGYKQKRWTLAKKNETLMGDNIYYVFVSLNELETPEYHIVPSKVVAETISKFHFDWLNTPGKNGKQHNDTNIRSFYDTEDEYLDKWDLFTLRRLHDSQVPKGTYTSLTEYISKLKNIEYGKVYPERQTGDGTVEHPFAIPFYEYAEDVTQFENAVYEFERVHPEFELNQYRTIMTREGVLWSEESMDSVNVEELTGQTTMALILACIRAEHFFSGALKDFLEHGYIQKLLTHLEKIDN